MPKFKNIEINLTVKQVLGSDPVSTISDASELSKSIDDCFNLKFTNGVIIIVRPQSHKADLLKIYDLESELENQSKRLVKVTK